MSVEKRKRERNYGGNVLGTTFRVSICTSRMDGRKGGMVDKFWGEGRGEVADFFLPREESPAGQTRSAEFMERDRGLLIRFRPRFVGILCPEWIKSLSNRVFGQRSSFASGGEEGVRIDRFFARLTSQV